MPNRYMIWRSPLKVHFWTCITISFSRIKNIIFIFQGKGFIKEVSFSPDGLILASPYDHGVRLLAFNDKLEDLSYCSPSQLSDPPRELYVVGTNRDCHQEVVLSTAFSPVHYTLVTGCRGGSIVWHQPRFWKIREINFKFNNLDLSILCDVIEKMVNFERTTISVIDDLKVILNRFCLTGKLQIGSLKIIYKFIELFLFVSGCWWWLWF